MALKDFQIKSDAKMLGNITVDGYLAGPSNFVIDPAGIGDDTGTVEIKGSLQVNGTTTTVNSTTLDVADLNITVAKGAATAGAADGAGLTVDGASATLTYSSTGDNWVFNKAPFFNTNALLTGVVDDTSPQLGGNLESNGFNIEMADNNKIALGTGERGKLEHTGASGKLLLFSTTGGIDIRTLANDEVIAISSDDGSGGIANYVIADGSTGATELYHYGSKKIATTSTGAEVTGTLNGHTIPGGTGTFALTSDLSGSYDLDGNDLIIDADGDTKIFASNDDELNLTVGAGGEIYFNFATNALKVYEFGTSQMTVSTGPGGVWPKINMKRNYSSTTPAAGDTLAQILARGTDSNSFEKTYGKLEFKAESVTQTSDRGSMTLSLHRNNQLVDYYKADATSGVEQNIFYRPVTLVSTDSGNTAEPTLSLKRLSSSPQLFDAIGEIDFIGTNSVGTEIRYGHIKTEITSALATGEDSRMVFSVQNNGSEEEVMHLSGFTSDGSVHLRTGIDLVFEGSISNGFETRLTVTNPTADRVITLPNKDGTVLLRLQDDASPTLGGHMTGNFDITITGDVTGEKVISTIATGTAPLTVASTTVVSNLNADLLDGKNASDITLEATALAIALG